MLSTHAYFYTQSRTIVHAIPPTEILKKRKNTALKPAAPSPLDSTFALQHGLRRGRWTMPPEVRKCHHLEVSHRPGSLSFGHINTWVVEGDVLGMCLQKFIYYFNSFSRPGGIGNRGTYPWAGNHIYVPSILFEEGLNVHDFISGRIRPQPTGLGILVWVPYRSWFAG